MPEKTIVTGQVILSRATEPAALKYAQELLGDRVHVIQVRNTGPSGLDVAEIPVAFVVWPEGQRCPCCDRE